MLLSRAVSSALRAAVPGEGVVIELGKRFPLRMPMMVWNRFHVNGRTPDPYPERGRRGELVFDLR
jgi:hypothetical protein